MIRTPFLQNSRPMEVVMEAYSRGITPAQGIQHFTPLPILRFQANPQDVFMALDQVSQRYRIEVNRTGLGTVTVRYSLDTYPRVDDVTVFAESDLFAIVECAVAEIVNYPRHSFEVKAVRGS